MSETMVSKAKTENASKPRTKKRPGPAIALLVALALFVVGTFSNVLIQTGFGSIKIEQVKLVDPVTKASINTVLYAPENATAENPAPVVITSHGGSQNLAQWQFFNLEYARRGYVVLTLDFMGSGETENETDRDTVYDVAIDYVQTLDFVIPDQIITTGHSMGGAMASKYASDHPDQVEGLILMGAYIYGDYPDEKTLTIYGSLNQSVEDHIDYTENIVEIEGGNHAQFGNYGPQKGDPPATISAQEQQAQTVAAIKAFLWPADAEN